MSAGGFERSYCPAAALPHAGAASFNDELPSTRSCALGATLFVVEAVAPSGLAPLYLDKSRCARARIAGALVTSPRSGCLAAGTAVDTASAAASERAGGVLDSARLDDDLAA